MEINYYTLGTLVPYLQQMAAVNESMGIKRVVENLPMRPFFLEPHSVVGNSDKIQATGFPQYAHTKVTAGYDVICGYKLYARSDWFEEWDDTGGPHADSGSRSGWEEYDTTDFSYTSGGDTPLFSNTTGGQTATDNFDRYEEIHFPLDPEIHTAWEEKTTTLSVEITKSDLGGLIDAWEALPLGTRMIGDTNLTWAGQSTATEGQYAWVQHAYFRFEGLLYDGTPEGMTGDQDLWNGAFSAHVETVTRNNAPTIYRERHKTTGGLIFSAKTSAYSGTGCFTPCPATKTVTLEDECTGTWRDDYGEYEWGTDGVTSGMIDSALYGAPWLPSQFPETLLQYHSTFFPCAVMFVSRDGKQYRITVEQTEGEETPVATIQMVTDPLTHRAEYSMPFDETSYAWYEVRKLERNAGSTEEPDWVVIAENLPWWSEDEPTLPTVAEFLGYAVNDGKPLFACEKIRGGSAIGFAGYTDSTTRFRTRRTVFETTGQPNTTTTSQRCGGDYPTAVFSYEILENWPEQSYDLPTIYNPNGGIYLDPGRVEVIEFTRSVGGTSWPLNPAMELASTGYTNGGDSVSMTATSNTTITGTRAASSVGQNSFSLAWDTPDSKGIPVSYSVDSLSVSVAGSLNRSNEKLIAAPAVGTATFNSGSRAYYNP